MDVLLINDEHKSHFVYIKDFNKNDDEKQKNLNDERL